METSIIPQDDGYLASSDEKTIFFPNAELLNVGCKNCIWKLHSQCPYGLKDDEEYPTHLKNSFMSKKERIVETDGKTATITIPEEVIPNGICPDMIQFLLSFADKSNSLTAIWEKFYNYKIRLQESINYREYIELDKKLKKLEKELEIGNYPAHKYSDEELNEMIEKLKSDRMVAKIWWAKLHQYASFTMQKIVDRETKQNEVPRLAGIHSSGTINFNIKQETKQIEDRNGN